MTTEICNDLAREILRMGTIAAGGTRTGTQCNATIGAKTTPEVDWPRR